MSSSLFSMVSSLVAILVFMVWIKPTLFKALLDKDNRDYPSLGRQGQFTAMIVSTWGFVAIILKGDLPEWFFVGYMSIWALAQGGSAWLKLRGQMPGTTTESSSTMTRTKEIK